jgi:hypothetical protein
MGNRISKDLLLDKKGNGRRGEFTINLLDSKKLKISYVFTNFHCTPVYQNSAAATVEVNP